MTMEPISGLILSLCTIVACIIAVVVIEEIQVHLKLRRYSKKQGDLLNEVVYQINRDRIRRALLDITTSIDGAMRINNAFRTIGLKPTPDIKAVKRAFRRKAKECHPDLHSGLGDDRFKELQKAYALLEKVLSGSGPV